MELLKMIQIIAKCIFLCEPPKPHDAYIIILSKLIIFIFLTQNFIAEEVS